MHTTHVAGRRFFIGTGATTLSAGAIAILAGAPHLARAASTDPAKDAGVLNVALALEHEGINAYQLAIGSGLLNKGVREVASLFQGRHKAHRDLLVATIQTLGSKPVEEKALSEYAKDLRADKLKNQTDILKLALSLESGAANAYLSIIPAFTDSTYSKLVGRLAVDETMHWTTLNQALGQNLPVNALSFGV